MYPGYLSILRTNDFRCVFRYYYGVNVNTDLTKKIVTKPEKVPILGIFSPKTILMFRVGLRKIG